MSTYSRRAFVSFDGPDEDGNRAEVLVTTGFGHVSEIKDSKGGRAKNIIFEVENTEHKISGWTPNQELIEMAEKAQESGDPLSFRTEIIRNGKTEESKDRTVPIQELRGVGENGKADMGTANKNTFKSLAGLSEEEIEDGEGWTLSDKALTNPSEDRRARAKSSGSERHSANDYSSEELRALNKKSGGQKQSSGGPSSRSFESPPYHARNMDGSLNLGSYAVGTPAGLYMFVADYVREHKIDIGEKEKQRLATVLLRVANDLQVGIYEGRLKAPDLTLGSHTRARAVMFESIRSFFPITEDVVADKESLVEYKDGLTKKALGFWKWSNKEAEKIIKHTEAVASKSDENDDEDDD